MVIKHCPLCGGKIIVSYLYQLSYNHIITAKGTVSEKYKVNGPFSMEVSVASCENTPDKCSAVWDVDDFYIDAEHRFVDYKYSKE